MSVQIAIFGNVWSQIRQIISHFQSLEVVFRGDGCKLIEIQQGERGKSQNLFEREL